ncbi:hypothetical protein GUJ93_ZPchr0004g38120 [Zizania palustris]|uniref:Uncharacterized protein n=1 Tax=Zizania palustris TaxID=103762 RepID=A0A8J5S1B0_ZIZPA|nr:hypothetical protein GUJ93_ZPchr0004g38120 [Zizania palustris]
MLWPMRLIPRAPPMCIRRSLARCRLHLMRTMARVMGGEEVSCMRGCHVAGGVRRAREVVWEARKQGCTTTRDKGDEAVGQGSAREAMQWGM